MKEQALVEAALYSSGRALTVDEITRTTGLRPDRVVEHLRKLSKEYEARDSAIEVTPIGTKWAMQIRAEYTERARTFAPPEIERDLLKTAALIAYHQPILQADLYDMIGDKVYEHTQELERLGLIRRKPSGRSLELTTTRYFAEFFGLKATDREGIRQLMARKAGIPYKEKPEGSESGPALELNGPADGTSPPTGSERTSPGPAAPMTSGSS